MGNTIIKISNNIQNKLTNDAFGKRNLTSKTKKEDDILFLDTSEMLIRAYLNGCNRDDVDNALEGLVRAKRLVDKRYKKDVKRSPYSVGVGRGGFDNNGK